MHREILKHPLLLKKYSNTLIYDYTEYPTKGVWDETYGSEEYKADFSQFTSSTDNPVMLYIHTPFCEELCYFCLCSKSITKEYEKVEKYLYNDLFKEIELYEKMMEGTGKTVRVGEVYFGGGSPTYYKEQDFEKLVSRLKNVFDFSSVKNFTVETDPRRVDTDKLSFYSEQGVNRLSFGVQDFDEGVQKEINRIQPSELFDKLLTNDIRQKFKTINFDILVGLTRQTPETMRKTIQEVVRIRPTEVQPLYFHYKPNTRHYMTRMTRNVTLPDFYDRKALYAEVIDGLLAGGYERAGYENFALPSDVLATATKKGDAYYNSLGTTSGEVKNFISLGSSAHGVFDAQVYMQNYYELDKYHDALSKGEFPIYRGLRISREDQMRHQIIKHFRIYDSLDTTAFGEKWKIKFCDHFAKELDVLEEFVKDGLIEISDSELNMTPMGREFTPRICEVFDSYAKRELFDRKMQKVIELVPQVG